MTLGRRIAMWAGIGVAAVTLAGAVWAAGDFLGVRPVLVMEFDQLRQEVGDNTTARQLARFDYLATKDSKGGGLSPRERAELCHLAKILGFSYQGCR